jgi:hypothetical protein
MSDRLDEKLPRVVVVTVRDDDGQWELEVDAPDLDPWQVAAYLEAAADWWDEQQRVTDDD